MAEVDLKHGIQLANGMFLMQLFGCLVTIKIAYLYPRKDIIGGCFIMTGFLMGWLGIFSAFPLTTLIFYIKVGIIWVLSFLFGVLGGVIWTFMAENVPGHLMGYVVAGVMIMITV